MSSEILLERGIGETRAVLTENGHIVELHVERADARLRAGDVVAARLATILVPRRRGIAVTAAGEVLIEPLPHAVAEGARLHVEIVREAIPEPGRPRLPKGRATDAAAACGPDLAARMAATGRPVRLLAAHGPDQLEAAGWSEALEEARSGVVAFSGGLLTLSLTPAMTVIDVDGAGDPAELAVAAAHAAGRAIRRHNIAGSIGIDFPTLSSKAERQRVAEALDTVLPPPFERTAVNGFGFLQIVRRRVRPSMLELVQGAPAESAALALLRRAEREPGVGPRTLVVGPAAAAWLAARPALTEELARRVGAPVTLREQAGLPIWSGHVDVRPA